jgi:hypothetical protein
LLSKVPLFVLHSLVVAVAAGQQDLELALR